MSKILAIKIFIFKRKLSMNLKNHSYIVYSVYYFKVNNPCNTNKCISLPLRPTIFLYSFYILRRYYLAIFRELTPQFLQNIHLYFDSTHTYKDFKYKLQNSALIGVTLVVSFKNNLFLNRIYMDYFLCFM